MNQHHKVDEEAKRDIKMAFLHTSTQEKIDAISSISKMRERMKSIIVMIDVYVRVSSRLVSRLK
jgi:hypothetical protein